MSLGGEALVEIAADYLADDPGTSYTYLYERLSRDFELAVSRKSFVSGGYATAAKRKAERRQPEPEPPEPPRPTVPPEELPPTALSRAELAEERRKFRERQAKRDADAEARAKRLRQAFALPKSRTGSTHPFAQDFIIGKRRRKNPGVLGDVEYLPAAEFLDPGVRRR